MPGTSTPSHTVGPFFSIGFDWMNRADFAEESAGERVAIQGRVLDGSGQPVPDAILEIWQADANGRYYHPAHADPRNNAPPLLSLRPRPRRGGGTFLLPTHQAGPPRRRGGKAASAASADFGFHA